MKFGHLILWKIFEFVATGCEILRLKCTKFNFGWGSAPNFAGELTALPDVQAGFNGPTFGRGRGVEWKGRGMGKEQEGKGRGGDPKSWFTPRCQKS